MLNKLTTLVVVLLISSLSYANPQLIESKGLQGGTTQGKRFNFAADKYDLLSKGVPPTLDELSGDPISFFRSETAYDVFKLGFETHLGESFSDQKFRNLLGNSYKVYSENCNGIRITNTRIDNDDVFAWYNRDCVHGEKLIKIVVGGRSVAVASLSTLNLVNARVLLDRINRSTGRSSDKKDKKRPNPKPPVKEPVAETPDDKPVAETPNDKPVTETPDDNPVTETPDDNPVTETPDDNPVTETPDDNPVTETPDDEPDTDLPGDNPVTETPDDEPDTDLPGDNPVTETPDDEPDTDLPGDQPVVGTPVISS